MSYQPFTPNTPTVKIAATAVSQNVAIDANAADQVRIICTGGNAYFRFTDAVNLTAATNSDCPLLAGVVEMFSKGAFTNISVIADTTATVFVTPGQGF